MKQYQDLLEQILTDGHWQDNRTGVRTKMIPGAHMKFDMADGFPAMTTKKLYFNAVKGELLGFLRGYTNAADFRELGCKIWDKNANETESWVNNPHRKGEDDLGYIYSRLWTDMPHIGQTSKNGGKWNQIDKLIETIITDPTSRRMIVSGWHPEVFKEAALPPCHVLFQVIIEQDTNKMHMTMYQRSCDTFLGVPFNIASYALLLHLLAHHTGYKAGQLNWFGADVHIYENHQEQLIEQIDREPLDLCQLIVSYPSHTPLTQIEPIDINLVGYKSHGPIKADMAA